MRIAVVSLVIIIAGVFSCSSDNTAPPDRAVIKDVNQPQDMAAPDGKSPTVDLRPITDGKPKSDAAAPVDGQPKTDSAKPTTDGAKPDAKKVDGGIKPDAKKADSGIKPDAKKVDSGIKADAKKADGGNACTPNPCQHGGTCAVTSGGFSCACTAGWKGTTCQTATYCDVLYRVTGTFHTTNAPLIGQFTKTVGTNAALPPFNPARTTPFTPAAFASGFVRLRFPSAAGAPAAGPVSVIEYFMPMEFSVTTAGTTVDSDVDHSAGLLQLSGSPLQIGDPPALSRACASVASGTLSGTTLTWSACSAVPDGTNAWTFSKAQSSDAGCLHRMSVWGNVSCSAGFCGFVPGLGNQRQTWDQMLSSFVFSGNNLATATFTMAEVQTPNDTAVNTYIGLTATSVVKVECDTANSITCNEQ